MHNELFQIGSVTIYGYGLMIAIGIISALLVTEYRVRRAGYDADFLYSLAVWGVLGGIIGAKLLYYIVEIRRFIEDPSLFLDVANGFVVYGAIIGGVAAGYLYMRVHKRDFWRYFDYVMPSVALAQGFGRIGCLLSGCCYGRETSLPIGIVFQDSDYAPNGVSLFPTQIISSVWNFLNFAVLVFLTNKIKYRGNVGGLYLINYGVGRFLIEFLRGDDRGTVSVFSTSQFISLFIVAAGIAILATGALRERGRAKGEAHEED